ncbi:MAG: adenosylcobinamide-GDP ribazoletransferase [Candidatus Ratteibacteria bacterium]
MNKILSSIQFLTILRFKEIDENDLPYSLIFFPLCGLIIGFLSLIINKYLLKFLSLIFVDTITVFFIIFITGAIHIDGVSDTFDGIFGGKNKNEILKIMRDKNIGCFGVLSILFVVLSKIFLLNSIKNFKFQTIILFPILSRWAIVYSIYFFNYARDYGKAKIFFDNINGKIFIYSTILSCVLIFLSGGINSLSLFLPVIILTYILNKFFSKKIGGLTGDTIGAIVEFNEILILLIISIFNGKIIKAWW